MKARIFHCCESIYGGPALPPKIPPRKKKNAIPVPVARVDGNLYWCISTVPVWNKSGTCCQSDFTLIDPAQVVWYLCLNTPEQSAEKKKKEEKEEEEMEGQLRVIWDQRNIMWSVVPLLVRQDCRIVQVQRNLLSPR